MKTYYARMMDAATGGEGEYEFEGPAHLFQHTADEIVAVFFEHVEGKLLKQNSDWELNSVIKNADRRVVTAMGSLIHDNDPPVPFLLMIADRR